MPRVEDMTGFVKGSCAHKVVFLSAGDHYIVCNGCGQMWEVVNQASEYSNFRLTEPKDEDKRVAPK